jgi:predicted MFS family arabinose efflux permease
MAACTLSGLLLLTAGLLVRHPGLCLGILIGSRLALGVGESLGSTGSTLWGISSAGAEHTAKVISFNGISTYGAQALGAPLGVVLAQAWGLPVLGSVIALICAASFVLASRKRSVPVVAGEHLAFGHVMGKVAPHGVALALGGVGYAVLAAFITLFYLSRHWTGAALCLTAFGLAFITARLLFIQTINRFGGFPVTIVSYSVESLGLILLWRASSPGMAFAGAALAGFGFSLVFPALGVEAVKRVPMHSQGTALGVYTAFADVSFFLVGPLAGALIGAFGYPSVFLFALAGALTGLGIVIALAARRPPATT